MVPELRPRGIGEILDAAVALYRARFGQLIRYSAIVVVPVPSAVANPAVAAVLLMVATAAAVELQ